jgi:hypothetical protein
VFEYSREGILGIIEYRTLFSEMRSSAFIPVKTGKHEIAIVNTTYAGIKSDLVLRVRKKLKWYFLLSARVI